MRIAIVDDEDFFLNQLKDTMQDKLSDMGITIRQIDQFHSSEEFFSVRKPHMYSVIFLDIYIDEENGVDIAQKIRETDPDTALVFCTTSNEFAAQSYEVDARYYLQKPITEDKVAAMLKRVNFLNLEKNRSIVLPDGYRCIFRKIRYTNYMNHSVVFYIEGAEPHNVYMSHSDAEKLLLPYPEFVTINKGNIVNMNMVERISKNTFHMKNGELLPISRRRFKDVSEAYAAFQFKKMESE
ncbi:MAG: LytTR family DNA-binding domain-containing protein [Eubacteriales bacterium]|nr:LytTR family DNA-binding domain-containing protein [Eubacteriales bacterium]